jgi:uncharacterized protein with von Willebrand factor type A (vWA) domain
MVSYQYSRWDGSQDIFPPDAEELMERLAEHLMPSGSLTSALRSLTQSVPAAAPVVSAANLPGEPKGIEGLLQRLRRQRRDILQRYDLDSLVRDIGQRLDEIERLERQGIADRLKQVEERAKSGPVVSGANLTDDERRLKEMFERIAGRNVQSLDALPEDAAGKLKALRDYEFIAPEARARFQELMESLRRKVAERYFKDISQRLQRMDKADLGRLTEMLKDLNRLLRERMAGGHPNFRQFKKKHADLFGPDAPETLDDFIEQMQRQAAQMESLLNSLSPDMRRQLQELVESAFQGDELLSEMAALAENLESLRPMVHLRQRFSFTGDEPLTLDEAIQLMEQLQGVEALERQLKYAQTTVDMSGVDARLLHELMGKEAAQRLESLRGLVRQLEDAGYISRASGQYQLTPKGTRRIGQRALAEIFAYVKRNGSGGHATRNRGDGGEFTEDTRRYEFGDPFAPHLQKTLMNAVVRRARHDAPEGGPLPLRLRPEDLEVYQPEQFSRASTVLMIDLSLSMAMRGNFVAAKKVALALHNLIKTRFPHDTLYVVGFSTYARELKTETLPYLSWDEFDPYTNIQHGFELAQQLLAKSPGGTRQIIMVSDGEPTAHVEAGQLYLQYPPSPRTLVRTLEEVKQCSSRGIVINTFMLDRNAQLMEFVDKMTRLSRGRVFYTSPERLGQYILVDYLASRRRVFG